MDLLSCTLPWGVAVSRWHAQEFSSHQGNAIQHIHMPCQAASMHTFNLYHILRIDMQRQAAYAPWESSSHQLRRCPRCWRRGCRWGCQRAPALTAAWSMAALHVPVTAGQKGHSITIWFPHGLPIAELEFRSLVHLCSWEHIRPLASTSFIFKAACLRDALQQLGRCLAAEGVAAALSTCGLHRVGRRLRLHYMRLQRREMQYELVGIRVIWQMTGQSRRFRCMLQLV